MEPISLFLSTFTALVDRIINLEKTKLKNKQFLFNEIVKPLFGEVEPVALNYIDFFRKARQTINRSSPKNLWKVVDKIKNERDAMVMARIKVREMAKQIEDNINDKEIVEFAKVVKGFFYSTPVLPKDMFQYEKINSKSRVLVSALEDAATRKIGKDELITYIDSTLESLEASWASIIQSYEKLKIYSISPPKFVHKRQTRKTNSK